MIKLKLLYYSYIFNLKFKVVSLLISGGLLRLSSIADQNEIAFVSTRVRNGSCRSLLRGTIQ